MPKITTKNIKYIRLWHENPQKDRTSYIVRVDFNFPCTWTTFTIDELLIILGLWIDAEEKRYPQEQGYAGRGLLFEKIKQLFDTHGKGALCPDS